MEPTTDMEREVEMLLTAGGATEEGLAEKEMEELKAKVRPKDQTKNRAFLFVSQNVEGFAGFTRPVGVVGAVAGGSTKCDKHQSPTFHANVQRPCKGGRDPLGNGW